MHAASKPLCTCTDVAGACPCDASGTGCDCSAGTCDASSTCAVDCNCERCQRESVED